MRRLVLPVWLGGLVLALQWLRAMPTGGDPAFTAARMFALVTAAYLVVATTITIALALCRVRVRLPLVPLLVVASLSTPVAMTPAFATTAPPPVMHRIDAPAPTTTITTQPPVTTQPPPTTPPPPTFGPAGPHAAPQAPKVETAATYRVQHGDCFWTIARRTQAARLGRAPSNREVASYWAPLIEANRAKLAHPANADLLFVGQELTLP